MATPPVETQSLASNNPQRAAGDDRLVDLAISRSIVESHGGRIWAARNTDRDSTFTFTLPVAAGEKEK